MFGYFKWKRIVGQNLSFIMGLLAPLGEKIPNQCFADPYVLGFLQIVTVNFVLELKPNSTPAYISSIFLYTLETIIPQLKGKVQDMLVTVNDSSHPYFANYSVGRTEGSILMKSRKGLVSAEEGKIALESFYNFIRRNYIND